jgi:hypothetical protein
VGGLLIVVGVSDPSTYPDGLKLNLWAGSLMAVFAVFMIALSICLPADEA